MLTSSRIKLILLSLLIPILVISLWSLTNNNNDTLTLYYEKNRSNTLAEVKPVEITQVEPASVVRPVEVVELSEPVKSVDVVRPIELPEPVVMPKIITAVPEKVSKEHADQIRCMAHNIYYEAGGEPYLGQVAVARVVMNRVDHGFAANPCQVIYQKHTVVHPESERKIIRCQFSWVCQGKLTPNVNSDRYKTAHEIAELVITENRWSDEFKDEVLFFHNHTVNPRWPYKKSFTIGNHTFYAKN